MKRFPTQAQLREVVATLALFLAVSGGAVWAASKINGKQIKRTRSPATGSSRRR